MPRSLTADELSELGIACCKNGEYQKAADAFTEVNIWHQLSIQVLIWRRLLRLLMTSHG